MTSLFRHSDEGWLRIELENAARLSAAAIEHIRCGDCDAFSAAPGEALVWRCTSGSGIDAWLLLTSPETGLYVNDTAVGTGIRLLADRDAIRLPGADAHYFSTERLARVEPLPDLDDIFCPRCKLPIDKGGLAVACSGCGVYHHEDTGSARNCWTYSPTCALCDQSTAIGADDRWTPEAL